MKNTKSYLHLYLGCKIRMLHKATNEWSSPKELTPNVLSQILMYDGGVNFAYQLLLRPLSDMTEDECLKLCSIVSPTIFGDFRYKKWEVTKEREWDSTQKNYTVRREGDDHSFEVDCIGGDILLWEDNKMIDSPYMDFNYRFEYLKMGFDLFGLIEAGLAVNDCELRTVS